MNTELSSPDDADMGYQDRILQGVSRTFALTIPQLPQYLSLVVGNAYLLCRIADTIEDDKHMSFERKREFSELFIDVVSGNASASKFAEKLYPQLSPTATADEHDLIKNTEVVIRITHGFNFRQRAALEKCIRIMAEGMTKYQETNVKDGLKDLPDMDSYCYFVAGVVGEMLTELFCDYSAEIDQHKDELMRLAPSFGQALQMTNILKDIWDDQRRGMCWLPQDIFLKYGSDLRGLTPEKNGVEFQQALGHLIGVARSHVANALMYILIIAPKETGIRRFCLWALGMAVLTLRKLNKNRGYTSGQDVKISRNSVKITIITTSLLSRFNGLLLLLFKLTARSLPETKLSDNFFPVSNSTQ